MLAIRSLVLGGLLSVWQYVKCQDAEFPINSPFVSNPTFPRSLGNSHDTSDEMYQQNLYDKINYEIGKANGYANMNSNINSNMNMNTNHDIRGPVSWHQSKSMSKSLQRRSKPRKTRNFMARNVHGLSSNVKNLLHLIDPELNAALDFKLNLPFSKGSPIHLFARRNAINNLGDDGTGECRLNTKDSLSDDSNRPEKFSPYYEVKFDRKLVPCELCRQQEEVRDDVQKHIPDGVLELKRKTVISSIGSSAIQS
ncbi:hypothetical protein PV325_006829 [Microctonus aethiopoides]|nr:hypothetical protein PV325_006829 [Microctonus aethiopoides]